VTVAAADAVDVPDIAAVPPVAVRVEAVRKAYGRRPVLVDVSFTVRRGELFALLGPNGAGKTTTVEIVEGYRRVDAGTVSVLGLDPARDGRALRPRLGLMLQEGGIDNRSTPREVLRLYAKLFRDPEDPDALLEAVDLGRAASTRYRRLSGGEKQRLGLAVALLGRPELLVLDEPTAGMDPAAKQATRERIAALRGAGTTILLTTHELGDVERLADHVAVLDRGRVVAYGTPAELTGAGAPRIRFRLSSGLSPADAEGLVAAVVPGNGATLVPAGVGAHYELTGLPAAPDPATVSALATFCATRGLLITELRLGAASLEERYLELVGADVAGETGDARDRATGDPRDGETGGAAATRDVRGAGRGRNGGTGDGNPGDGDSAGGQA
jgi:ABC-2 type transport system ATP-binding protein